MFTRVPEGVVLESTTCVLGCSAGDLPVLTARERLFGLPGEFHVVRCQGCGLLRTNPRPTPETIGFYYPESYGPYQSTRVDPAGAAQPSSSSWKSRMRGLFQFNTYPLPYFPAPGRMLEIGCASGAFMHAMAGQGWEVEGVEFSPSAAAAAQQLGYRVHVGPLETAPDPFKLHDLVVGWMVLEHLHDPLTALQKLWRWTAPRGWLVVSIPNAASFEFTLFRDAWYALQLPTHLFHYTPDTLRLLLLRAGWRMERVFFQRDLANLAASVGYRLEDSGRLPAVARKLIDFPDNRGRKDYYLYPLAYLLSLVRQTGRMTVWARKDDD